MAVIKFFRNNRTTSWNFIGNRLISVAPRSKAGIIFHHRWLRRSVRPLIESHRPKRTETSLDPSTIADLSMARCGEASRLSTRINLDI